MMSTIRIAAATRARCASGVGLLVPAGGVSMSTFPGAGQLRPVVIALRSPLRILGARDLYLSHIQLTVAVGANVLRLRASQLQHAVPGAGLDRHPEPAQTDAAPVLLVPNAEIEQSAGQNEPDTEGERVPE